MFSSPAAITPTCFQVRVNLFSHLSFHIDLFLFVVHCFCVLVLPNSNIVTDGFYVARTGLGPFGEGWEEKGEDVDWFLYNRLWGVGVFTLIEHIGLEPTEEVSFQFSRMLFFSSTVPYGWYQPLFLGQLSRVFSDSCVCGGNQPLS